MSVFHRRSRTQYGVRCDFCGRITNNPDGEYTRPDGSAGYINDSSLRNDDDQPRPGMEGKDSCEECSANRCPACGSERVVNLTPTIPGPYGWGGRCKDCGNTWFLPVESDADSPTTRR